MEWEGIGREGVKGIGWERKGLLPLEWSLAYIN